MSQYQAVMCAFLCKEPVLAHLSRRYRAKAIFTKVFMAQSMRQLTNNAAKLLDLCIMLAALMLANIVIYSPREDFTLAGFMTTRIKLSNILLFTMLLFIWHLIFAACGLYVSKRLTSWRAEAIELCKATLLAVVFLLVAGRIIQHDGMVSSTFVVLLWIICVSLMVSIRLVVRFVLRALRRRGRNSRFMLIVGTNPRALEFARRVRAMPELGYQIVGFVDDDWSGMKSFLETGNICRCDFSGLPEFLRHNVVDEAAIYLPLRSYYEHAAQLVALCEEHGITTRFDSQIFNLRMSPQAEDVDGDLHVFVLARNHDGWPIVVKRIVDCIVCVLLLVSLSPILLIVAVLVKCTSSGSVFFRQTRIGLNKRQFRIFKFRTMIANAEQLQDQLLSQNEMSGPVFKINRDPRVTPLGRILRRTSIDELPQLLNVLKGDMSLVGPRAMSLRDYQLFDQDWHRRRFSVKPGITCLWQVNGRNSIPFERWMELDIQYIDKWSLWLDFKILARTVPAVLRGTGAA